VVLIRRVFAGLASVLVVGGVMLAGASGASAVPTTACGDGGTPSQSGSTVTCSYASGATDTFTVPAGVTSVTITAVGGAGGNALVSCAGTVAGGEGASVTGSVAVTPGDSLAVTVGENGSSASNAPPYPPNGGFGHGSGGNSADCAGSGGGGSAVIDTTTPATLVVAGGGGGALSGAGGNAGQDGSPDGDTTGGMAGGSSAAGAGGQSSDEEPCVGGGGSGGNGGTGLGGGGGGGLWGGGAGCGNAGGGGGSSLVPSGGSSGLDSTATPLVTISYTLLASPSIGTSQQPTAATVGSSIADKATLTGGDSPTGTVTFNLYNTPTGAGTPLFTDTETLSGGAATSKGYTTAAPGTDYWVATYNGDGNNASVTGAPNVEPVVVSKATPLLGTTQQPASAALGGSIADKATVSGGDSPSGTVTFNLYSNSGGTGTPLFTDTETLSGGVATSKSFTPAVAATDYWVAIYNGDANNNGVTGLDNAEPVSITKTPTSLKAVPQLVLFEPFVGIGNQVVQATLTSGGIPLAGQTVYFSDGPVQLCHANTNAKGVARCTISSLDQALLNRNNQYTATFTATTNYVGSTSTVPAITFIW
jgi:hypothetical protein